MRLPAPLGVASGPPIKSARGGWVLLTRPSTVLGICSISQGVEESFRQLNVLA